MARTDRRMVAMFAVFGLAFIGSSTYATLSSLPPAQRMIPATYVERVGAEDACSTDDPNWILVAYEGGECTYVSR